MKWWSLNKFNVKLFFLGGFNVNYFTLTIWYNHQTKKKKKKQKLIIYYWIKELIKLELKKVFINSFKDGHNYCVVNDFIANKSIVIMVLVYVSIFLFFFLFCFLIYFGVLQMTISHIHRYETLKKCSNDLNDKLCLICINKLVFHYV